jgi:8-oxo-dGTP pyrophosphatase MutT (NUDIX family)
MPALPGRTNHIRAGVLLPLRFEPQAHCILTLRARHLRQHGGEVCFPGGRPEDQDANLEQTALREASEELGIENVRVLGSLSSVPLYTSEHRLVPVVGAVGNQPLRPCADEVERVLELPLEPIFGQTHIPALSWMWGPRQWLSPVFEIEGEQMFGATAHVFLELLHVIAPLMGRPVPCLRTGGVQWSDLMPSEP